MSTRDVVISHAVKMPETVLVDDERCDDYDIEPDEFFLRYQLAAEPVVVRKERAQ